jgi:hypothetical protein
MTNAEVQFSRRADGLMRGVTSLAIIVMTALLDGHSALQLLSVSISPSVLRIGTGEVVSNLPLRS